MILKAEMIEKLKEAGFQATKVRRDLYVAETDDSQRRVEFMALFDGPTVLNIQCQVYNAKEDEWEPFHYLRIRSIEEVINFMLDKGLTSDVATTYLHTQQGAEL